MNSDGEVSAAYRGLWRRLSLENESGVDTTTRVVWLQGHALYADLRVPVARPDFSGIESLDQCSVHQLRWLAGQGGFAGRWHVRGDIFHWHRQLDFQPDATVQDVGRMVADGEEWLEYGVHAPYVERWRRSGPGQEHLALTLHEERCAGTRVPRQGLLLAVDRWFIYCRGRSVPAAPGESPLALASAASDEIAALRQLVDFEISFGPTDGPDAWNITLSTLPFREGRPLFECGEAPQPSGAGWARQRYQETERLWRLHAGSCAVLSRTESP